MDITLQRLENWKNKHKAHAVSIGIDNGYGATCWTVELDCIYQQKVLAAEVNFFCYSEKDQSKLKCKDPNSHVVYVHYCYIENDEEVKVDLKGNIEAEDDYWDWPGLEATINAALDKAEQIELNYDNERKNP